MQQEAEKVFGTEVGSVRSPEWRTVWRKGPGGQSRRAPSCSPIAVLSRLKIKESEGQLLASLEEPTGIIRVSVDVGGSTLQAHGIWLGLSPEERARQLAAALDFIGEGRATLAGDLNSTPDSPVYAEMLAHGFADPFETGGFSPDPTAPAETPLSRIDYVWLRGLVPTDAQVLDSSASDHRMVVVEGR